MRRMSIGLLALSTLGLACAGGSVAADGSTTSASEEGDAGSEGDAEADGDPYEDDDGGPDGDFACNVWAQTDCGSGEKCVLVDPGGGWWPRCVPIRGSGEEFDPCCVNADGVECGLEDEPLGTDTCRKGLVCTRVSGYRLGGDPQDELMCRQLCGGSALDPTCEGDGQECRLWAPAVAGECVVPCDPLTGGECSAETGCGIRGGVDAECLPPNDLEATGQLGEACDGMFDCGPGLGCFDTCDGERCCTELCAVSLDDCELPGTTCTPLDSVNFPDLGVCE